MEIRGKWLAAFAGALSSFLYGFSASAADENTFKVGVEAFEDHYREPGATIDVNEHAYYGAIDLGYTHSWDNILGMIEARGSYGRDNYKSVSGQANDIPQYETEARLLGGVRVPMSTGDVFIPYFGLGSRFYYDNSKNVVTNTGFFGYDRRILQMYLPIGVRMEYTSEAGWTYAPTLEFDPLLWGNVNTRLQNIPGFFNIDNTQHHGYGWRGEFMVGQKSPSYSWEAGPYFRYWNMQDSDITTDPLGNSFIEPKNTRLQAGAALRLSF